MSNLNHARMMLKLAQKDLKALQGMKDTDTFDDEVFGFHAQQAVEKTIKAWLSLSNISYPRTHDLDQLFSMLKESGQNIPKQFLNLINLSDFAVQFRYELFEYLDEELDRNSLIQEVKEFHLHVEKQIESVETQK